MPLKKTIILNVEVWGPIPAPLCPSPPLTIAEGFWFSTLGSACLLYIKQNILPILKLETKLFGHRGRGQTVGF